MENNNKKLLPSALGMILLISLPLLFFNYYGLFINNIILPYLLVMISYALFVIISINKIPQEKAPIVLYIIRALFIYIPFALIMMMPFLVTNILVGIGISLVAVVLPFLSKKMTYFLLTSGNMTNVHSSHKDWLGIKEDGSRKLTSEKIFTLFFILATIGSAIFSHSTALNISDSIPLLIMRILSSIICFFSLLTISAEIRKHQFENLRKSSE